MTPGREAAGLLVTEEPRPPAEWERLVAGAPGATFFHTRLWTETLARCVPGATPLWWTARRGGDCLGGLVAVRRRRGPWSFLESHYAGTAGGPLVAGGLPPAEQDAVAAALLAAFARAGRRPGSLAASVAFAAAAGARWGEVAARAGLRPRLVPALVLPLAGGLAAVEYGVLPKNRRNERNRALRRGCTHGVSDDPAVCAEYYPIYLAAASRWGERPVPLALLQGLLRDGGGAVFLSWVRREGRLIGAHLCFHHGDEVVAWNGTTDPAHHDVFPATVLVWTDVVEACARGAARLDLGGSAGVGGVARFKELLGAAPENRLFCQWTAAPYGWWRRWREARRPAAGRGPAGAGSGGGGSGGGGARGGAAGGPTGEGGGA